MNIQLLALDLDGTTMRTNNTLAPDVKNAIERAILSGIEVAVISGRPYTSMPREILEIRGIRWIVASNGAAIYQNGVRVHADRLRETDVLRILDLTKEHDLIWEAFCGNETCSDKRYYDNPLQYGCSPAYVDYVRTSRGCCSDMRGYIFQNRRRLDCLDFVSTDSRLRQTLWAQLESALPGVYITSSSRNFVEMMNRSANKANALRQLCARMNIDIKNTAAAGNADNDADMLALAGIGAAVRNAAPACLNVADAVIPSNDEGGVRELIMQLL